MNKFWDLRRKAAAEQAGRRQRVDTSEQAAAQIFGAARTAGINFDQYDAIKVVRSGLSPDTHVPELESFGMLTNPDWLCNNIKRMGYEKPTPIQRHAIPVAIHGFDIMCCAQTGSGKTAAFLTPIACSLGTTASSRKKFKASDPAQPLALVLAPTRELASQIHNEALKLCFGSHNRAVCVYGGASANKQLEDLARGVEILVATPGRLTDFVDRSVVTLASCKFLVLDEADRMLDMGFEPQIRRIVQQRDLPPRESRSTFMFSATFAREIQKLAAEFMREFVWIAVGRVGSSADSITQRVWRLESPGKPERLRLCIKALNSVAGRTLIFVQTKRNARWVARQISRMCQEGDVEGCHSVVCRG